MMTVNVKEEQQKKRKMGENWERVTRGRMAIDYKMLSAEMILPLPLVAC